MSPLFAKQNQIVHHYIFAADAGNDILRMSRRVVDDLSCLDVALIYVAIPLLRC